MNHRTEEAARREPRSGDVWVKDEVCRMVDLDGYGDPKVICCLQFTGGCAWTYVRPWLSQFRQWTLGARLVKRGKKVQ